MPLPLSVSCFSKIPVGFYRAMLGIRGTSHGPVSVRPSASVTSRCSTKTAKRRITQTTPHDSPGTLVFWQRSPKKLLSREVACTWTASNLRVSVWPWAALHRRSDSQRPTDANHLSRMADPLLLQVARFAIGFRSLRIMIIIFATFCRSRGQIHANSVSVNKRFKVKHAKF